MSMITVCCLSIVHPYNKEIDKHINKTIDNCESSL